MSRNITRLMAEALTNGYPFDLASGEKLIFKPMVDNQGSIEIGDGTTDMDLKIFLGASTDFATFDNSAGHLVFDNAEINMGDSDEIEFGDGQDVAIQWDGTTFNVAPSSGMWKSCPLVQYVQPLRDNQEGSLSLNISWRITNKNICWKGNQVSGWGGRHSLILSSSPGPGGDFDVVFANTS